MFWFNIRQVYLVQCYGCPCHVYRVHFNDALEFIVRNFEEDA